MLRRLTLVLVGLGLACGGVACASPRVGPTAGSGYVFSVQVDDSIVWRGPVNPAVAARFPQSAEVIVTVHDTQVRPVDGVPVTFELEPEWARHAVLTPSDTRTRGGIARALFSEAQTSGVVRIMVRVDGTAAQVRLTVLTFQEPSDSPESP